MKSYQKEIKVESPLGARNWGIGNEGLKQTEDGYWQDWNSHISPRSLYLQQLEVRHPEVLKALKEGKFNDELTDVLEKVAKELASKY